MRLEFVAFGGGAALAAEGVKKRPDWLGAFGVLSLYEPVRVHLTTTNVPLPYDQYEYYCHWYCYHGEIV